MSVLDENTDYATEDRTMVERYGPGLMSDAGLRNERSKTGIFVRHSDYAELEAENARLVKELDEANEELGKVIMACPPGMRSMPISMQVSKLRAEAALSRTGEDWVPDARTVEACAKVAREHPGFNFIDDNGHYSWRLPTKHDIATAITALSSRKVEE